MVTIANRVSQKLGQIRFLHQIKEEKLLYMLSTMVCNSKNFFGAKNAQTEICASRAHPFHHKSDNRMPCISQKATVQAVHIRSIINLTIACRVSHRKATIILIRCNF